MGVFGCSSIRGVCNADIGWGAKTLRLRQLKPGKYTRSCAVPRVSQLFVGYGDFEPTRKAIELDSKQSKWDLWIDDRRVDLPAFGTSDRTLFGFPAAGGKDVILRDWRVILVDVTPGEHTIRYRNRHESTDATWTFTVPKP